MKVLIIIAHPNVDKSLNHHLAETAKDHFLKNNHEVRVVDLYKIKFNPVGGVDDFKELKNTDFFDYQLEQMYAVKNNSFSDELNEQFENIRWCDLIIYQFPLYWWSVPAIMKGYIDRVYAYHFGYGGGHQLKKMVMYSLTSGGDYTATMDQYMFHMYGKQELITGLKRIKTFYCCPCPPMIFGRKLEDMEERKVKFAENMRKHLDKYLINLLPHQQASAAQNNSNIQFEKNGEQVLLEERNELESLRLENETLKKKILELEKKQRN